MRLSLGGLLVSGAVFMSQASAWAADTKTPFPSCTTTPTEADRKAAQGAFAAGQGSFNEADYATAITYWRDAYKRDCTAHPLLLNLARAYELRGDRGEAVNALETYLQRKPDDGNAEQIRRRIENLKAQMAASAPAPVVAPTPVAAPVTAAAPASASTAEVSSSSKHEIVGPLLVGGGGLILTLIGAGVYSGGAKKVSDAESACPNRVCKAGDTTSQDSGNEGKKLEQAGGALIGVGLAAVAGGVVWYFVSGSSDTKSPSAAAPRTALLPAYAPGFAGLAWSGRF